MIPRRARTELRAGGCTEEEIALCLRIEAAARRRARMRMVLRWMWGVRSWFGGRQGRGRAAAGAAGEAEGGGDPAAACAPV